MHNKKKVAIVFTGGTISMTVDEKIGAAIPSLSGEQIMSMVTNIDKVADIEVFNFDEIPGPHMTPEKMLNLRNYINDILSNDDISGVVVTHGTDSLEETAYFLDLTLDTPKPVIVTGAMRSSDELGYDGPSNLAAAVCTAISDEAYNKGVLVVLSNEVLLASEATKTNTLTLNTFKSLTCGPLGIIDCDKLVLSRDIVNRETIVVDKVESDVALIKSGAGMDESFINFAADKGCKGIVIEAMGRGNIPPGMLKGVEYARSKDIPVIIATRCHSGRVFDSYGYLGSGRDLRNLGCIFAGDLPGQKARIKLIVALGKTNDSKELKDMFEKGIYY
ncbi:L-asparaginase [[Clostridium] sordellii]|uniref:asparaginase n=1 Tax=Paraclostridium sordellii TaxID=1505 RepID=A0A0A8VQQ3_PARSO|nr:asparaginase [Paeniclostridium sordellii]QYE97687.1 asparaginase [Paeniclostridium sordellii]TAN69389.1 asparaginase [Paeniclostridium sordellii 8483]CEK32082.1 L-asparaginase [[Clostridium] sordellii] [Paeniclostridium sordellii]CEO14171.1 L-asparaginase [[Clostridium] sordellii] [Paeniclostridium sordellii]CEP89405.1 L-asparaginase [[Clostridium] sordellii] [Paeniclostridium sordellii]